MTITMIMMVIIIKYFFIPFKGKSWCHTWIYIYLLFFYIFIKYMFKRLSFKSAHNTQARLITSSIIKQNRYYLWKCTVN